ncbi:MAG: hypothetical protein ABW328_18280 [Ilumatobacteraceae bacterium]
MAKNQPPPPAPTTITRDDLQRSFQSLQDGVRGEVDDKRNTLLTGVGIGGLVIVILIFLLGRRSGKKKTTFVEIRRV